MFPAQARAILEPFFKSGQEGILQGERRIRLGYRVWEVAHEKGAVVFLPGRGDPFQVFQETIRDLVLAGYSVYALDERGQGSSQRLLRDTQKGYVDDFGNYAKDLHTFVRRIVNAKPHAKKILMSHSMGGAISARYLIEHQNEFDGAVLIAPLIKANTKPYKYELAELVIAPALVAAHRNKEYAPDRGPFDANEKFSEKNELTTSAARFDAFQRIFIENPALQVGGATVRWVTEVFENSRKLRRDASRLETPILLVTAGQDSIVDVEEQGYFCSHVKTCKQVMVPEAKHNVLIETDKNRDPAMSEILGFLAR